MAIIALLVYNLSFKVLHTDGRPDGRVDGWVDGLVKIMPLVAPTDQLKLDRADLPVEARCGKKSFKNISPDFPKNRTAINYPACHESTNY